VKLFILLILMPLSTYAVELPKAVNTKQDVNKCIKDSTKDCIKAACIENSPTDCAKQCSEDAVDKCKVLKQQL